MTNFHAKAVELTGKLSLERKVQLLTGRDFWNTWTIEEIGLRNMLLSDGPAGVRGEFWDERDNSLNLPSGSALGSTWNRAIAQAYGVVMGAEAARKGVDVVLGPTINLHRSPLGGRHFECLSEDAMLTGVLAANYVHGLQSTGKGACPKHYIANDFETNRFTVNVKVGERALRELYLRPFEEAVKAGAWSVMSSYNSINGPTATENELLDKPLKSEWGFDGVVISDWTAVRSLESAKAEQDLVMPGPQGPWGEALVAAVQSGEIAESVIDRKIVRILTMALRVGAIGENGQVPAAPHRHNDIAASGSAFAKKVAIDGTVLLQNDGILPIDLKAKKKVALIGHNALAARTQGGGSASVHPLTVSTPYSALTEALGDKLSYSIGAVVQPGIGGLDRDKIVNPVTGKPGVRVEFFDEANNSIFSDDRLITDIVWIGSDVPLPVTHRMTFATTYTPDVTEVRDLGFTGLQHTKMLVNGEELLNLQMAPLSGDPFEALMQPPHTSVSVQLTAGVPIEIVYDVDMTGRSGLFLGAFMFRFGFEEKGANAEALIAEAVANAKDAEVAIVIVGTNAVVESEGYDRKDLKLPGRQDELVSAVMAANPNTIVVVNSGSPVEMPWVSGARAVILPYFGGQEMGNALVDMLTGVAEPGGRLPTTWAKVAADLPVINCTPDANNEVEYTEGIHIGYKAWLKAGTQPLYAFGHGLGYTSFSLSNLSGAASVAGGDDYQLTLDVTNTGSRSGKFVAQAYASRAKTAIERPVKWLAGFESAVIAAGETKTITIPVSAREFANWDGAWKYESGEFTLEVGTAVDNLTLTHTVSVN